MMTLDREKLYEDALEILYAHVGKKLGSRRYQVGTVMPDGRILTGAESRALVEQAIEQVRRQGDGSER